MANNLYNFSCDVGSGRKIACNDSLGGVQKIYIMVYNDDIVGKFTLGAEVDGLNNEITDCSEAFTVYKFDLNPNVTSFTSNITANPDNGSVFYDQVLEVALNKIQRQYIQYLDQVIKGRCQVWVLDANENVFFLGAKFGCTVTGGSMTTGLAKADRNGFNLTFTAQEPENYIMVSAGKGTADYPFDTITGATVTINAGAYPA
jgi:hypothetical protein